MLCSRGSGKVVRGLLSLLEKHIVPTRAHQAMTKLLSTANRSTSRKGQFNAHKTGTTILSANRTAYSLFLYAMVAEDVEKQERKLMPVAGDRFQW